MAIINKDFFNGGKLLKMKETLNLNENNTQNKYKKYNNYDFFVR